MSTQRVDMHGTHRKIIKENNMITIKVLGPGCENCKRLAWLAGRAAQHLAIEAQIIKVTDYKDIMKYDILSTPGLVINEKLVSSGRIPSEAEITTFLTDALETA
jgi:small redox-active disulfide protein 2